MKPYVEDFKKRSIYHWFRNSKIICIQYTSGIFTNLEKAAQEACKFSEKVVEDLDLVLGEKITLLGFSQGGIIARYLLQHCSIGTHV